jgi:hypothetical protein
MRNKSENNFELFQMFCEESYFINFFNFLGNQKKKKNGKRKKKKMRG